MELKLTIKTNKLGVYIEKDLYKRLEAIIAECGTEVGWLCLMDRISRWEFKIKDIFIPSQQANSGTTDIDPSAIGSLENALWAENKINMDNQESSGLYMWGHSHVNMSTSPSSQDESQFEDLCKNKPPYFIRMIANKKGEYSNTAFINDKDLGEIILESVPFMVLDEELSAMREEVRKELKEKVRPVEYKYSKGYTPSMSRIDRDMALAFGMPGQSMFDDTFDTGRHPDMEKYKNRKRKERKNASSNMGKTRRKRSYTPSK